MARYRKAIAAFLIPILGLLGSLPLGDQGRAIVAAVTALATALGVYAVPNSPAPKRDAGEVDVKEALILVVLVLAAIALWRVVF